MDLKTFRHRFFGSDSQYATLSVSDKAKNAFMLNRNLSAKFPALVNYVNVIGMPAHSIVDSWRALCQRHGILSLDYVPTKKAPKKVKTWYPNDAEVFKAYRDHRKITIRVYEDWLKFEPDLAKKDYKEFEKNYK